jgi:hypothetical protein
MSTVIARSLSECECKSGLLSSLGEVLSLDDQVANAEHILRDESLHGTRTVLDRELGAVCLVSGRGLRVVLGVKEAGNRCALHTRNPEVARAAYNSQCYWSSAYSSIYSYPVSKMTLNYSAVSVNEEYGISQRGHIQSVGACQGISP